MTVTIQTTVTKTVPAEDQYSVRVVVTNAIGIDTHVFVFDSSDDTFLNVASVYDMETYPRTVDASVSAYRAAEVSVTYDNVLEAERFADITRNRLQILANAWNSISTEFSGEVDVTITSAESV